MTGYRFDSADSIPVRDTNIYLPHRIQTGCWDHKGAGTRWPDRECDHSALSIAELKNVWTFNSIRQ